MVGRKSSLRKFWTQIDNVVKIKSPGPEDLKQFLNIQFGIDVINEKQSMLTIQQAHYTKLLLERFQKDLGGTVDHSVATPAFIPTSDKCGRDMVKGIKMAEENEDDKANEQPGLFAVTCRSHEGGLMWLMRASRPDIGYAVISLSRQVHKWTIKSERDLYRILQYLKGTINLGIKSIIRHEDRDQLELVAYIESDFAGDRQTRRSTSGWTIFLKGPAGTHSIVDWGSKMQGFVSRSSAEAELVAISRCSATKLVGYRELLQSLSNYWDNKDLIKAILYSDSKTAITCIMAGTSKTPRYISKTQAVHLGWLRTLYEDPSYTLRYISTNGNPSDTLTKSLARVKFSKANKLLCIFEMPKELA